MRLDGKDVDIITGTTSNGFKTLRNCGVIQNSELEFLLIMNNS